MNLRQIRQFAAVAETLNFRKAAEKLHIAQPPLSVSIKRLEAELGTPLFLRERRGLRLTAAGEAILADVRQILFHAEQLKKTAAGAAGGMAGHLRVAFVGSATYTLFPLALPAFRARYPQVQLELREGTTSQMLRQVERGEIDVGLVRYPVVEATTATLVPVQHDTLVAALPAASALARRKTLKLRDLAEQPFILYAASAALNLRTQVLYACESAGFQPRIVQEAVQVQTILSLVESGMGVSLVPSVSRVQVGAGVVLKPVADAGELLAVAIAAATHPEAVSAAALRFRELLQEVGGRPGRARS